jgi:hypothetical protein
MLSATRNAILPTTITGSYPRPSWFVAGLHGRPFKEALGESLFREQYLDAVAWRMRAVVAINLGANIVRRELGLPEVAIAAADPRFTLAGA